MKRNKVIIAGGSGFIGQSLAQFLDESGYDVVILSRSGTAEHGRAVAWDGRTLGDWARELEGAAALVNLAGRNVSCRYTVKNKREMNRSRVDSTVVLGQAIRNCTDPPTAWVQASTTAILGDRGDQWLDESTLPGDGYPTETSLLWEHAFEHSPTPRVRRVVLRISFVLGAEGGALGHLRRITRLCLGGAVGDGRQYISWIHQHDLNRIILRAIEDDNVHGLYNATGLNPVTNAQFMATMRNILRRPWCPPTPAPLVRLGAWLMGTWGNLALWGRRVQPRRLIDEGFKFAFDDVEVALRDLLKDETTDAHRQHEVPRKDAKAQKCEEGVVRWHQECLHGDS